MLPRAGCKFTFIVEPSAISPERSNPHRFGKEIRRRITAGKKPLYRRRDNVLKVQHILSQPEAGYVPRARCRYPHRLNNRAPQEPGNGNTTLQRWPTGKAVERDGRR